MASFAATSPRLRDGRRATMGSFGTLLPRPSNSASSPRLSARTTRQGTLSSGSASTTSLTGSLSAANWQGMIGVLTGGCGPSPTKAKTNLHNKSSDVGKERDGYEVFFGVSEADSKGKVADRDGFDIFYGIKNDERTSSARDTSAKGDSSAAKDPDAQLRARISQVAHPRRERRLTAPAQLGTSASKHSDGFRSPRSTATTTDSKPKTSVAKSKRASKPEVPDSVPTFSLATPAPSFAPELAVTRHDETPTGVPLYSMATPCQSFAPPTQ